MHHKHKKHSRLKSKDQLNVPPERINFSANFTAAEKVYDIFLPANRIGLFTSMSEHFGSMKANPSYNPVYEDPTDMIEKKNIRNSQLHKKCTKMKKLPGDVSETQSNISQLNLPKETKVILKQQKKKLTQKYEALVMKLMDRCEEDLIMFNEKQSQLQRFKEKLKELHQANNQFADANDLLHRQHQETILTVEELHRTIQSLEHQNIELQSQIETRQSAPQEIPEKLIQDVPVVAICTSCTSREILVKRTEECNLKLEQDLLMMKNVVYRLNVQLSRYQEKLKDIQTVTSLQRMKKEELFKQQPENYAGARSQNRELHFTEDSIMYKGDENEKTFVLFAAADGLRSSTTTQAPGEELPDEAHVSIPTLPLFRSASAPNGDKNQNVVASSSTKYSDVTREPIQNVGMDQRPANPNLINEEGYSNAWGDVNSHTLAPLLNAYQESIKEKDNLIRDYEKQFNVFTLKFKQILNENSLLHETREKLDQQVNCLRQKLKELVREKERLDLECGRYQERMENAEKKLKDVYDVYEDKVSAMSRDYEMVHREYYVARAALSEAEARAASLAAALRPPPATAPSVPADVHERRIQDCKRLFEELKHQYDMERDKLQSQTKILNEKRCELDTKMAQLKEENDKIRTDLKKALKDVKLYRRAATVFRTRLHAAMSRQSLRRRRRLRKHGATNADHNNAVIAMMPNRATLERVEKIKGELQSVKREAYRELAEVERRMREQQQQAEAQREELEQELARLHLLVQHKEAIIQKLIDKVADVVEDRSSDYKKPRVPLPQVPRHIAARKDAHEARVSRAQPLVPVPGGYFTHKDRRKGNTE